MTEDDIVRLERDVEALKAETVKLAMAFASLAQEIDDLKNPPPPGVGNDPHVDG